MAYHPIGEYTRYGTFIGMMGRDGFWSHRLYPHAKTGFPYGHSTFIKWADIVWC